jgi:hypothetical protein
MGKITGFVTHMTDHLHSGLPSAHEPMKYPADTITRLVVNHCQWVVEQQVTSGYLPAQQLVLSARQKSFFEAGLFAERAPPDRTVTGRKRGMQDCIAPGRVNVFDTSTGKSQHILALADGTAFRYSNGPGCGGHFGRVFKGANDFLEPRLLHDTIVVCESDDIVTRKPKSLIAGIADTQMSKRNRMVRNTFTS